MTRRLAKWASRQLRGTYRRGRDLVGSFSIDGILPNGVASFIQEVFTLFPLALGRGSARSQVFASSTLIIIAVISTPFTLGWSLALAVPFVVTLMIGLARLVPAINDKYRSARGNRLRDRDIPLWRRD